VNVTCLEYGQTFYGEADGPVCCRSSAQETGDPVAAFV
jgi:hypothetical protein